MICKWIANNPLTIEERHRLKEGIKMNLSYSQLAKYVGRPKSSVMRESKRLGKATEYDAEKAQKDFESKQKLIGTKKKSKINLQK